MTLEEELTAAFERHGVVACLICALVDEPNGVCRMRSSLVTQIDIPDKVQLAYSRKQREDFEEFLRLNGAVK